MTRPTRVLVAAAMALLAGCTSIDAVTNKQLDICRTVKDEALRVKCVQSIPNGHVNNNTP